MKRKLTAESAETAEKSRSISANSAISAVKILLNPSGRWQPLAVALFHLAALALTARLAHWPYPLALLTLAAVTLPLVLYSRLTPPQQRNTKYAIRDTPPPSHP
ncbi:MAG TPA: hypothetical protein VJ020_10020, partial [Anaerolineales bacterium]|nr:hypothetical protein [Anaerolineales bacterium]